MSMNLTDSQPYETLCLYIDGEFVQEVDAMNRMSWILPPESFWVACRMRPLRTWTVPWLQPRVRSKPGNTSHRWKRAVCCAASASSRVSAPGK